MDKLSQAIAEFNSHLEAAGCFRCRAATTGAPLTKYCPQGLHLMTRIEEAINEVKANS